MPRSSRGQDGRLGRALAAGSTAMLLAVVLAGPVLSAAQGWTVVADRLSVPYGTPATVTLTITNTSSDNGGSSGIGCVTVAIPTAYAVTAVSVANVSGGLSWSASIASSPRGIVAVGDSNGDRLRGDPDNDVLVLKVAVTGKTIGVANWTANEFQNVGCDGNYKKPVVILMTVLGLPATATPKPTLAPTPEPTATPTRAPTPTPTAVPTATPIPTATSPGSTPTPTPTPTRPPTATPTPTPTATPRPTPTPTDAQPSTAPGGGGLPGSGGAGGGTGGGSGGTGGGGSGPAPEPALDLGERDPLSFAGLDTGGLIGLGVFDWAVPGAILAGPGLLLMLLIAAQALGALAWLPIVRRKVGSFGPTRRRRATRPA